MLKRSSLQLSINAIVVLILAITILGLGLGFIKDKVKKTTDGKENRIDKEFETKIIIYPGYSVELFTIKQKEFEVRSGTPTEFYIGIRNTEARDVTYYVQFMCDTTLSGRSCRNDGSYDLTGNVADLYDANNQWKWFKTFAKIRVPKGKAKAVVVDLLATGTSETYKGIVKVWKCNADDQTACADPAYKDDTTGGWGTYPDQALDPSGLGHNENPVAVEKITLKVN